MVLFKAICFMSDNIPRQTSISFLFLWSDDFNKKGTQELTLA